MEVLIAIFIMAIGMLALLALFPVGAVSMAQALKDDRCASAAAQAEQIAIAFDLRQDFAVTTAFTNPAIPPGSPVYMDPYGAQQNLPSLGGVIQRVTMSLLNPTPQGLDALFSLPDDLTFLDNGTPDVISSGGVVPRGGRYTYTYLLRPLQPTIQPPLVQILQQEFRAPPALQLVQLYVVVYSGRTVNLLTPEPTYTAAGVAGANGLTLSWATGQPAPNIRRGGWILDTTTNSSGVVQGYFYRVTNLVNTLSTSMVVEVQSNLIANVNAITVMDDVAEVFDKGTGPLGGGLAPPVQ
jgi:hypothetical protein